MRSPLRVLICRSNSVAPDPRVAKEAKALSEAGYRVKILAWDRDGNTPKKETIFVDEESKVGVEIIRLHILSAFGRGMQNLPSLLRWQAGILIWMWRNRDSFDLIHACDFDTILPSLFVGRIFRKKIIYDIFDFYADHLRKTPRLIKSIIRSLDIWAINRADALILADPSRKDQIQGANPRKMAVIYNSPEDIRKQISNRKTGSSFSVVYVGLLQLERGLGELLQVMQNHPSWSLDLAGFGGDREFILERANSLKNVIWHGRVAYEKAMELSAKADVLIATYDPAIPNHRYSSPNKLFEAMMLGKPIVVAKGTNMDGIVKKWNLGLLIDYGDVADLERALETLHTNSNLREELGENARQAYDDEYSWEQMRNRLTNLYSSVVS